MNAYYDQTSAVIDLEESYASSIQTENDPPFLMDAKITDYRAKLCHSPPWWKLVERDTSSGLTEAFFRVRGIICFSSLPPVKTRGKQSSTKSTKDLLNMKQMLTITGLGSSTFHKNTGRLYELSTMIQDTLRSNDVAPLDTIAYEGHPTLHTQNRYFTERKAAPNLRSLPFLPGVDDHSILKQYNPQELLHSIENRVEYATIVNGQRRSLHPRFLLPGDIVELVVSLVAIPVKNHKFKTFVILRGVCLLDSSIREQSQRTNLPLRIVYEEESQMPAKRKNIYFNDDEEELAKRLKRTGVSNPGGDANKANDHM